MTILTPFSKLFTDPLTYLKEDINICDVLVIHLVVPM